MFHRHDNIEWLDYVPINKNKKNFKICGAEYAFEKCCLPRSHYGWHVTEPMKTLFRAYVSIVFEGERRIGTVTNGMFIKDNEMQ